MTPFPHLPPRYNGNIVESGVKHHNPPPFSHLLPLCIFCLHLNS